MPSAAAGSAIIRASWPPPITATVGAPRKPLVDPTVKEVADTGASVVRRAVRLYGEDRVSRLAA